MEKDFFEGIRHNFDLKYAFYVCVLVAAIASIIVVGKGIV